MAEEPKDDNRQRKTIWQSWSLDYGSTIEGRKLWWMNLFGKNDFKGEEEIWLYWWVNQEANGWLNIPEDWWTINFLLVSWTQNTIESSLRSTISHVEIAHDLWNDIRDRFSLVNGPRIQ